jgi:hypothetical protein
LLNNLIHIFQFIYHLLLVNIAFCGFKNFNKLSRNLLLVFILFAFTMLIEWLGFLLSLINESNTLLFILYDFVSLNIVILFYLNNFDKLSKNKKSYFLYVLNFLFFITTILFSRKLIYIDTVYTIFFSFVYIILGLFFLLEHLTHNNKSRQVLGINFLFIYFAIVTLCYKFLANELYSSKFDFNILQILNYVFNISGFFYVLKLIKKKNETVL